MTRTSTAHTASKWRVYDGQPHYHYLRLTRQMFVFVQFVEITQSYRVGLGGEIIPSLGEKNEKTIKTKHLKVAQNAAIPWASKILRKIKSETDKSLDALLEMNR